MQTETNKRLHNEEIELHPMSGMACMLLNILATLAFIAVFVIGCVFLAQGRQIPLGIVMVTVGALYAFIAGPILFGGLRVLKPNEALVLTLFGRYHGTLKGAGFFWINPFCTSFNPAANSASVLNVSPASAEPAKSGATTLGASKKISLKAMTLNNERQKINDKLGNPVIIGIVVIWKVVNTTKAVFNVDNYKAYLSIQCDSALRNIVRQYTYDNAGCENETSLLGSSTEIAEKLRNEIQSKVDIAGIEIIEARITHLSYSEEIAAVMLQRQQASAIIDARQMIVEGAVGMVEMALEKLSQKDIVRLDEERKAVMVSNLLVVLCGNRDAQPIVNTGSLY